MEKIWFIKIAQTREGPFSFQELRGDPRVTPDTLVWRKGFQDWIPIRKVPELKDLFKDGKSLHEIGPSFKKKPLPIKGKEELVLDFQKGPPPFLIVILIVILILLSLYSLNMFS